MQPCLALPPVPPSSCDSLSSRRSPGAAATYQQSWALYDPVAEYARIGLGSTWRVSQANADCSLCPTYPEVLVVPASVSDDTLADLEDVWTKLYDLDYIRDVLCANLKS